MTGEWQMFGHTGKTRRRIDNFFINRFLIYISEEFATAKVYEILTKTPWRPKTVASPTLEPPDVGEDSVGQSKVEQEHVDEEVPKDLLT